MGRFSAVVGWVRPRAVKSTVPKVRARRVASRMSLTPVPVMGAAGAVSRLTRAFWFSPETHQANVPSPGWLVRLAGKSWAVSVTRSLTSTGAVLAPTSGEE